MTNKIEDIIKTKNKTLKKFPKGDDMLSKLAEERNKKSLPNRFQYRNNENVETEKKEIKKIFSNPIKIVDTTRVSSKQKEILEDEDNFAYEDNSYRKNSHNTKLKLGKYIFFSLAFLTLVFFVLNFFSNVKIFITPKIESFVFVNEKFTATKGDNEGLDFEIMIVEATEEKEVSFSDKASLSSKAKGTVTLYNEYSTTSQKLLINTRLSDDKGLIYMTDKPVTIPGYTKSGSKIVPGSVSVTVTAQESGSKYNSGPKDFKIVGFKGTAKYDKMYARAKTSFSGGVSGNFYTPNDKEKGEISSSLEIKLRDSLAKKIEAEMPEGYISYPGSMQFSFSLNKDKFLSETQDGKVEATGKFSTVIFKENDIRKAIIKKSYANATEQDINEIDIPEIKDLDFSFTNSSFNIAKDTGSISFNLSGDFTLQWHPVKEDLVAKLVGIHRKDIENVLREDPGISKVRIIFRPPWQNKVPKDIEKIKIIEEI